MSEQAASRRQDFRTALREQRQRVVAALRAAERVDATPILQEGEVLSGEEYVTLVYELHHVHLPALEAAGVIEFVRREETVRQGPDFDSALQLRDHRHDR